MYYLNTDSAYQLFQETVNSEIFVDKSMLIDKISRKIRTADKYICITRPRRFGKSVNAHMLAAYYTAGIDTHTLFDRLAVSQTAGYAQHRNSFHVIFIDLSRMPFQCHSYEAYITNIYQKLKADLLNAYPKLTCSSIDDVSDLLRKSGDTFLFILDEWDSIFWKDFMTQQDKCSYLMFLKNLLKDQPYVGLAYMTGVLPIAKHSSGSELNMFDEYSFMNDTVYEDFFGFQEKEVRQLCQIHHSVSYQDLARWYDGYYMSDGRHLFNPRSVIKALTRGICSNYWTQTVPMNEIADCIKHNTDAVREDLVKMTADIPVEIELLGYSASEQQLDTRDEILSAMTVYGFLSYHDGQLRIPNRELMEKFQHILACDQMGEIHEIVNQSRKMLEATLRGDTKQISSILENVHDREIPFLQYNDENSLSCVITLCYLYARKDYHVERESKSGKGYCDYIFLPKKTDKPAIILELKTNDTCDKAIAQIKEKDYITKAKEYASEIILVGISYDKKNKSHSCLIEKI